MKTTLGATNSETLVLGIAIKHWPNAITGFRLLSIPVIVFLLTEATATSRFLAFAVFLVAAISDAVDGFIARKFQVITPLGTLLDPLADKLLILSCLIMLVSGRDEVFGDPFIPPWMVVLCVAREFWVTGLRAIAASNGVIVSSSKEGKVKTILQVVAVALLLLYSVKISFFGTVFSGQYLGLYTLMISLIVGLWSAFLYSKEVFEMLLAKNSN